MTFILVSSGPGHAALTDQPIVPANQVRQLGDAAALLSEAEGRLASVDEFRAAAKAQAEAEGYAAGLAQGREAAAVEVARQVVEMQTALAAEREAIRASVGRLALDVVRRITADIGPETTVAALAHRAVREVLPDQPLTVRVPSLAVGAVSARLWPLGAAIEVQADDTLGATDCVLETPAGRTLASLDVQLAALETLFAAETRDDRAVA